MPLPPARSRSARVPCGVSSTSSSAGQVLPGELLVLPDVGGHHPAHLAALQQHPQAPPVDPAVVREHLQVAGAGLVQRRDQHARDAAQTEAADREARAVGHVGHGLLRRWGPPCPCGLLLRAGARRRTVVTASLGRPAVTVRMSPTRVTRPIVVFPQGTGRGRRRLRGCPGHLCVPSGPIINTGPTGHRRPASSRSTSVTHPSTPHRRRTRLLASMAAAVAAIAWPRRGAGSGRRRDPRPGAGDVVPDRAGAAGEVRRSDHLRRPGPARHHSRWPS